MPEMVAQRLTMCLFLASLRVNAAWQAPHILVPLRFFVPCMLMDLKASSSRHSVTKMGTPPETVGCRSLDFGTPENS